MNGKCTSALSRAKQVELDGMASASQDLSFEPFHDAPRIDTNPVKN